MLEDSGFPDVFSQCQTVFLLVTQSGFVSLMTDLEWISRVRVNTQAVLQRAQHIQGQKLPKKQWQVMCLLPVVL